MLHVKRALDLVAACLAVLCLSPVLLVVALLVRWRLGAPILFRQERPGKDERPFMLVKFRSMRDPSPGAARETDRERLTPFGAFLRRTSLDELPELFNVIRGEMSLVGPRPLLMRYLPAFTARERVRFRMRPGITGLAQVSGRNLLNWDDRLALDVEYVERWSLALDVRILARTLERVIRPDDVAHDPAALMRDLDDERGFMTTIEPALPDDAEAIIALKREAFSASTLPYTVYQAAQASEGLARLLAAGSDSLAVQVARRGRRLIGYYMAHPAAEDFHLAYIAVDPVEHGSGAGRLLLQHFEEEGRRRNARRLTLDVAESNLVAREWYARRGYNVERESWLATIALDETAPGTPADVSGDALHAALEAEGARGYGRIAVPFGSDVADVGLLAGDALRLFSHPELPAELVRTLRATFPERTRLLLVSLPTLPDAGYRSRLRSFRLAKFVTRREQATR